jgi:hypothetical protein
MRMRWLMGLMILTLAAVGCGGGPVPVSGTVRLDGEPVTGHIVFVPVDEKRPKRGGPIEGGTYNVPAARGPLPGPYKVEVYSRKRTGKKIPGPDPEQTAEETIEIIPEKYNRDSTLTVTFLPGTNSFDFDLTTR